MKKNRYRSRKGKGRAVDLQIESLVHRKLGVWDLYVERNPKLSCFRSSWKIEEYVEMWNNLPYLWRSIRDVCSIAWPLLLLYVAIMATSSLVPALKLWCVSLFGGDMGFCSSPFQVLRAAARHCEFEQLDSFNFPQRGSL